MDEIINILQDTLHYSELAKAYAALNKFEKEDLYNDLYIAVQNEAQATLEQMKMDYDVGFRAGQKELAESIVQDLQERFGVK